MTNIIEILFKAFGQGGNIAVGIVFLTMIITGIIIAMCGRRIMVWLVGVCGTIVGILAGAMVGILVFDSFILMTVFAIIGGSLMILIIRYLKGLGYFIGISMMSFFLVYVLTSEMYITNTKTTESTLLLIDLVVAVLVGLLSITKSKFFITLITSVSGGIMTSISILGIFGIYFSDWKTWTIAALVAIIGMYVQFQTYGLKKSAEKAQK